MTQNKNFEQILVEETRKGNIQGDKYLIEGQILLYLVLEAARREGVPLEYIQKAEERGMLTGDLYITYEGAKRIYDNLRKAVKKKGEERGTNYLKIIDSFDPITDHDLIANAIFCLDPEIQEKVENNLEGLYRVVLSVGSQKRRGKHLPVRTKGAYQGEDHLISKELEELISAIPRIQYLGDEEYQRRLRVITNKKAEREIFPLFKDNPKEAFKVLEEKINKEKNENLRDAYLQLKDIYNEYSKFKVINENPNFQDPETGKIGVLPSLHQRIALYHLLKEKRFGIFDGCGTGKTAIATLAQPLIEEELKRQGKEFKRTVVVCTNSAKKAWKKGLIGEDHERYLVNKEDITVIDNGIKNNGFLEELKNKKWIVLNYEQLTTRVNGSNKLLVELLADLGVDYLISDESHHVKSKKTVTKSKKPTRSSAFRFLALKSDYVSLLTGSPIHDKMDDYSVIYHLLNTNVCPHPEMFEDLYHENPRILYTLFNEKTIRRKSEDINDLDWEEKEEEVKLDPIQRQLYQHIVEFRPKNWLMQARKALLDPRLVDPEVLDKAGLLGKVRYEHSAKYKRLEELLTNKDGPIKKGENFIIFSSMFREGVTDKEHEELKEKYLVLGIKKEFNNIDSDFEKTILIKAIGNKDSSLRYLEKKLSPRSNKDRTRFKREFNEAIKSLIKKNFITLQGDNISIDIRQDGPIENYRKMYSDLGLNESFTERLEKEIERIYEKKIKIGVIDGKIKSIEEREKIVDYLGINLEGILCTTDTGGESLDFVRASYGIFLDKDYNPNTTEQALSRLIRKGQKKKVTIAHLSAEDTLDEELRDYVFRKKIIAEIATDGYRLTPEEENLLNDTEGKSFGELIKGKIGGVSIDISEAYIDNINDFEARKRLRPISRGSRFNEIDYNTTDAQKIMKWIGQDPLNCWKDPEFVELYVRTLNNLSVPVIHKAKISDLIRRAKNKEMKFPRRVLSEGSGPSLLYNAYQSLDYLVKGARFKVPFVLDRDTSQLMLLNGNNPNRLLGCMTGKESAIRDGSFDMVDNESISLLRNPEEVKASLTEANRVLKPNGIVELIVKNMRFIDNFYSGMRNLGFEIISEKDEGFRVGKEFFRRLKIEKGEHFAESYSSKLENTHLLIAKRKDNPGEANSKDFWFERITPVETDMEEPRIIRTKRKKRLRKPLPGEIPGLREDLLDRALIEEENGKKIY